MKGREWEKVRVIAEGAAVGLGCRALLPFVLYFPDI